MFKFNTRTYENFINIDRKISSVTIKKKTAKWCFPDGTVIKNPPANAGDTGLIPGPGRSHMLQSN